MRTATATARLADWLVPAWLVGLGLVPSVAGGFRLAELARGGPVTVANARFFAMPLPVWLHIAAAMLFAVPGAFQFSAGFRRRVPGWHRAAGLLLVPLGLVVALTGLWMTLRYPWAPGDGEAVYGLRLVFGTAMAVSVVAGVDAIRRRDFAAHGAWMTRAYAIGLGAGTQVFTHLPWLVLGDRPGEAGRAVAMGAGWVINLAVAEWVLARGRKRGAPVTLEVSRSL
jgi:uncharacterized membrane protein